MAKLKLQLVTPERTVLSEEVVSLICPTLEGQITILPGHVSLISTLVSGELIAKNGGEPHNIHVAGGFLEVRNNGTEVVILADAAEHFYEIDIEKAEEAKAAAEKALLEQKMSDEEYAFTAAVIQKSLNRINIARKHANRRNKITSQGVFHE